MTRVLGERGTLSLQPGGGRSSSQFLPFFNIEAGNQGAVMAIGWSVHRSRVVSPSPRR